MMPSTSTRVSHWSAVDGPSLAVTPGQTWFGSAISQLIIPLHLLWIHSLYCDHSIELLPTTLRQAAQGCLPDFFRTSKPNSRDQELGLLHIDKDPVLSMQASHSLSLEIQRRHGRGAPMAHQCGTRVKALPAPGWRAVGWGQSLNAHQLTRQTHCTDRWPVRNSVHWSTCPKGHAQATQ